eukprot:TRINITY_DN15240_c0_g1_i3.p2 TRINITY_DN15240_c0_g1~~TRINITY_DN15240_c0_g1_i3.p2  ORF type:complete len:464 (+),score=139.09 TRINITY_DN15240_c0_g1_i3:186-1577(+)
MAFLEETFAHRDVSSGRQAAARMLAAAVVKQLNDGRCDITSHTAARSLLESIFFLCRPVRTVDDRDAVELLMMVWASGRNRVPAHPSFPLSQARAAACSKVDWHSGVRMLCMAAGLGSQNRKCAEELLARAARKGIPAESDGSLADASAVLRKYVKPPCLAALVCAHLAYTSAMPGPETCARILGDAGILSKGTDGMVSLPLARSERTVLAVEVLRNLGSLLQPGLPPLAILGCMVALAVRPTEGKHMPKHLHAESVGLGEYLSADTTLVAFRDVAHCKAVPDRPSSSPDPLQLAAAMVVVSQRVLAGCGVRDSGEVAGSPGGRPPNVRELSAMVDRQWTAVTEPASEKWFPFPVVLRAARQCVSGAERLGAARTAAVCGALLTMGLRREATDTWRRWQAAEKQRRDRNEDRERRMRGASGPAGQEERTWQVTSSQQQPNATMVLQSKRRPAPPPRGRIAGMH